jgi:hypothetical protein
VKGREWRVESKNGVKLGSYSPPSTLHSPQFF